MLVVIVLIVVVVVVLVSGQRKFSCCTSDIQTFRQSRVEKRRGKQSSEEKSRVEKRE